MVDEIRILTVYPNRVSGGWTLRGESVPSGEQFRADLASRDVAASCIGAKVLGFPVKVTRNDKDVIIAVTSLW